MLKKDDENFEAKLSFKKIYMKSKFRNFIM